jgi:hypothetical protein
MSTESHNEYLMSPESHNEYLIVVFSGLPISSTNETDRHDIAEILLKVMLSTIKQTNNHEYILSPESQTES